MMKTTMRRYENFQFYNSDGIEAHLTKMAKRGWQLQKITPFSWKYQKIAPQSLHYTVTYFSEASEFNPHFTENQEVFYAYCQDAGWNLVAQWAQMQIFCSDRQEPTPIETDEAIKLKAIHKAMKKNFLPSSVMLIILSCVQIFLQLYTLWDNPIDLLSNGAALSTALGWNMMAIAFALQLGGYFRWYRGSKQSIALGGGCLKNGKIGAQILAWVTALALLALVIIMTGLLTVNLIWWILPLGFLPVAATVILAHGIKHLLKRKGVSRRTNFIATIAACLGLSMIFTAAVVWMIFQGLGAGLLNDRPVKQYTITAADGSTRMWDAYQDPLPLAVEDLQDVAHEYYSYQWHEQSSFFLSQFTAAQHALPNQVHMPNLEYEIVDVKWPIFFDICLKDFLKPADWEQMQPEAERRLYRPIENNQWQAEPLYQMYRQNEPLSQYLICWDNRIVEIRFEQIPTEEQIAIVVQKLKESKPAMIK